jgi:hypothetical protein
MKTLIIILFTWLIWLPNTEPDLAGYKVYSYSIWHHAAGLPAWTSRDVGLQTEKELSYILP